MNKSFTPTQTLPLILLLTGVAVPLSFYLLAPDNSFFDEVLGYWFGSWSYLGLALWAIEATDTHLASAALPGDERAQPLRLAHIRSVKLLLIGIGLLSLTWGHFPLSLIQTLLFITLRLGLTLLLLGAMVLLLTHGTLRKLGV